MSAGLTLATSTWAATHGIVLSAHLYGIDIDPDEPTGRRETWMVEAVTAKGMMGQRVQTDGSYTPDPFEILFGVWAEEPPTEGEFSAAVNVLGPEAVGELARLVRCC